LYRYLLVAMADDDDHDHHGEPNTFINSPATSSIGVVAALLAYWICLFAYVENDCAALEKLSREGKLVGTATSPPLDMASSRVNVLNLLCMSHKYRQVKWTTFDKHYYSTPSRFIQPASKEELVAVVKQAVETVSPVSRPLGMKDPQTASHIACVL
jgi:hypothetical protein